MPTNTDRIKSVMVSLTPDERSRLRAKAGAANLSMSAYVLKLVLSDLDAAPNGKKTSKKS